MQRKPKAVAKPKKAVSKPKAVAKPKKAVAKPKKAVAKPNENAAPAYENELKEKISSFVAVSSEYRLCILSNCSELQKELLKDQEYLKNMVKLVTLQSNQERLNLLKEISKMENYKNYTKCNYTKCEKHIKDLSKILIDLLNMYKKIRSHHQPFDYPPDVIESIEKINAYNSGNESIEDIDMHILSLSFYVKFLLK